MSTIGGYTVVEKFRTTGGGRCKWTLALKGGTTYFLKCFLTPKPYVPGRSPDGPSALKARKARCAAFESRQNKLLAALAGKGGVGGNLIVPIDFFTYDGCYYKVTEKIDTASLGLSEMASLSLDQRARILRSAANSVRILHASGIVHGDVKLDNILIRKRSDGTMTSSIIDFDDSYFQNKPPMPPEEFVFDPPYAAPEVFRFVVDRNERHGSRLTTAADVFSLGIVFHEFLCGGKPKHDGRKGAYLGEARLEGNRVFTSEIPGWPAAKSVIDNMLSLDPTARPDLKRVLDGLVVSDADKLGGVSPVSRRTLIVNMGKKHAASSEAAEPASCSSTKLRGSLSPRS